MPGDQQIAEDEGIPVQNGGADAGMLEVDQGQLVRILRVAKDVPEVEVSVEDLGPVQDLAELIDESLLERDATQRLPNVTICENAVELVGRDGEFAQL